MYVGFPIVTKTGTIPTLEFCVLCLQGHPHLFLSTFRVYGVHIRKGQTSGNALVPICTVLVQISSQGLRHLAE